MMEAIAEVVAETGVLKGKRRRAVDSTVLDDAVARQDTITQLIAAVRRFGRDIPGGQDLVVSHAKGYDYIRTGKPDIAWDDQDAKDGLISALVTDALALLAAVNPETLEGKGADAYVLLALIAGPDVEPAEDSDRTDGRWPRSGPPAPAVLSGPGAPPHRGDAKSNCTNTTRYSPNTVNAPRTRPSRTTTAPTGPWSNSPSPGSPSATDAFPTAA